jgi:hypothetical protein
MMENTRQMPFYAEQPHLKGSPAIRMLQAHRACGSPRPCAGDFGPPVTTLKIPGNMDNITFGLTMLIVGMGGTLITLWVLAILIGWLTRLCQPKPEETPHE